jgi:uncharacterized protein YmfQ (DUF2313 family)
MHSNQNDENNPKEITGTQEPTTTVFKSPTSSALVTTTKQQQQRVDAKEAAKKLKKSSSASRNFYAGVGKNAQPHNLDVINSKKRTNGYCECCKQRYDNLKQVYTVLLFIDIKDVKIHFSFFFSNSIISPDFIN